MMWNYLADAVARLRAWPRLDVAPDAADPDVLAAAFPGWRYVWLRREDKLRQAILRVTGVREVRSVRVRR